jgi:hypothetical protein
MRTTPHSRLTPTSYAFFGIARGALSVACLSVVAAASPAVAQSDCDTLWTTIVTNTQTAYIEVDSECYPSGFANSCGFQLSQECQDKYATVNNDWATAYDAFNQECPNYFGSPDQGGTDPNTDPVTGIVVDPPILVDPTPIVDPPADPGDTDPPTTDPGTGGQDPIVCEVFDSVGPSLNGGPAMMYGTARTPRVKKNIPIVRTPTKKEMLQQIKSLKKQLRKEKKKSRKLSKRCVK